MSDERLALVEAWLKGGALDCAEFRIAPASADASFRRYFRVVTDAGERFIVMDAPPEKEDCRPFVAVAQALSGFGLNVPKVLSLDLAQGLMLLSDLGNEQYLQALSEDTADRLYGDAIEALVRLQQHGPVTSSMLPRYSRELLLDEMQLFSQWLLTRHLGLDPAVAMSLRAEYEWLATQALAQPQVWVHRDYHSRNLMVTAERNPGVLDFQDAVVGPLTYDLVSLLKDCYIAWPRERVVGWVRRYFDSAAEAGLCPGVGFEQLLRWFDLMGVQRHLKAAGIFSRLNHRDGKPGYLGDIPRTLNYVAAVCGDYPSLSRLGEVVEEILPRLSPAGGVDPA